MLLKRNQEKKEESVEYITRFSYMRRLHILLVARRGETPRLVGKEKEEGKEKKVDLSHIFITVKKEGGNHSLGTDEEKQ